MIFIRMNLFTLDTTRMRGDLIETQIIIKNHYNVMSIITNYAIINLLQLTKIHRLLSQLQKYKTILLFKFSG